MSKLDDMIKELEEHQHKQGCETCGALNALKALRDQINTKITEWDADTAPMVIQIPIAKSKARELKEMVDEIDVPR